MTTAELLAWVDTVPGVMVEITGGEPMLQPQTVALLRSILAAGRTILLETNGSLPLAEVPDEVGIIMDVKCPDSGMAASNLTENIDILRQRQQRGCRDEVKFVLCSEADFYWACTYVKAYELTSFLPVLFSPVQPGFSASALAELLLASRLNVRLQLQLHTLLWPGATRGV